MLRMCQECRERQERSRRGGQGAGANEHQSEPVDAGEGDYYSEGEELEQEYEREDSVPVSA